MDKCKILQVQGGMNKGGVESVIMGWYRTLDKDMVQFDFTSCTQKKCPYDDEIIKSGGKIIYLPPRCEVGNLKHMYFLYKLIKDNGPYEAIHSHMNFHGGIVALVAKIAGVKKIVMHAHNTKDDGRGFKRKIEIFILRKMILKFSDKLLACGNEAGKFIYGENAKFEVINNAVDNEIFNPKFNYYNVKDIKKNYNLQNKIIVGHIGRFTEQKNHKFIIKIIEEMKNLNNNFKVILIGDGELREKFLNEIKTKNLDEYILYLGLQDNINEWISIMDIFILPSLYEGLPVVLVEAQSAGLPCLVSEDVSKESDLGLNLIKFIPINDENIEKWALSCLNPQKKLNDNELIQCKLKEKGFLLSENTKRIISIYLDLK